MAAHNKRVTFFSLGPSKSVRILTKWALIWEIISAVKWRVKSWRGVAAEVAVEEHVLPHAPFVWNAEVKVLTCCLTKAGLIGGGEWCMARTGPFQCWATKALSVGQDQLHFYYIKKKEIKTIIPLNSGPLFFITFGCCQEWLLYFSLWYIERILLSPPLSRHKALFYLK